MRSVSFTRSSCAPVIKVSPNAWVAAKTNIGISSTAVGISSDVIVVPCKACVRTIKSAVGSPSEITLSSSITAPMRRNKRRMPSRVGLTPTPVKRSSLFGTNNAATIQNAADEISPGTLIVVPVNAVFGVTIMSWPSRVTATPNFCNIRSVWSRVASGSVITVSPSACKPAKINALFTCADATGKR